MKGFKSSEKGMVIVEATIVFPVMFLVIFLMIFAGNAYLQKCRIDSYVNQYAIKGASYCADPMLDDVEKNSIPGIKNADIRPYRYFFGGMDDIEGSIEKEVDKKIRGMSTGLFSGMKPTIKTLDAKFNNGFIYSTFSVEVDYKIRIPVKLLGASDYIYMNISSRADMPVSDTTEFIRNVNMVEDYMQKYGVDKKVNEAKKKLNEAIEKAKEWMKK